MSLSVIECVYFCLTVVSFFCVLLGGGGGVEWVCVETRTNISNVIYEIGPPPAKTNVTRVFVCGSADAVVSGSGIVGYCLNGRSADFPPGYVNNS